MRHWLIWGALAATVSLAACEQAGQETASSASAGANAAASAGADSSPEAAAAQQRWAGAWLGDWENDCQGAIEVIDVTADSARVRYSWGDCGDGPPGSYIDPAASIEGDELTVHLAGDARAVYTHVDADTLRGEFRRPSDGTTITGTFERQS